jgi:hypothetical protein
MTREELDEALLRFGADLERWPVETAQAARRLIAGDPEAAKLLTDYAAFEETLTQAVKPPLFGAGEIGAVLAARDRQDAAWWPSPRFLIAGAGISALSFAIGFMVMLTSLAAQNNLDVPLALVGLAVGQADLGGLL